ncbi:caspase family protein [Solwaraspora sp. WMMA2065]|uniref:caspase family protein n=1 Tax=Solwaraspora sp. WMMA2065 TaxID=3015166 RepID=UPI00259BBB68|nr:caspase family protein [Solwaraspora sp. WMMA2065]WJK33053.1 caspase family protein [Solwaraspora sp. WMMA2065]
MHAFVVGVGAYPYCDDPADDGPAGRVLGDLGSVTSPPPSAAAVAEWLLHAPRGTNDPPVGTVEVLISSIAEVSLRLGDGTRQSVGRAVFDEFKAAFRRWRRRCDSHRDNIALFYFCGHGWELDGQLLLLEDLGRDPDALLENCVELSEIRTIMQHCRARTQVYFVDACRQMPPDFAQLTSATRALMDHPRQVRLPLSPLDAPVYFSTARRFEAQARQDAVTPFTAAVLRTLDGLGAHPSSSNGWTVATDRFGPHLRDVIIWDNPEDTDRLSCLTVEGEQSGVSVLRTLDGPPLVPFRLTCEPAHALPVAEVSIRSFPDSAGNPMTVDGGRGEVSAGVYHVELGFPDGVGFRKASAFAEVLPPNRTFHTEVEQA